MKLVFTSQQDFQTALAAANAAYGCPYQSDNYFMNEWAIGSKHATQDLWEFDAPEDRPSATAYQVSLAIIATGVDFEEVEELPEGWK